MASAPSSPQNFSVPFTRRLTCLTIDSTWLLTIGSPCRRYSSYFILSRLFSRYPSARNTRLLGLVLASALAGFPLAFSHWHSARITRRTRPCHAHVIHCAYSFHPVPSSCPAARAASCTYDITWMKSRIATWSRNRAFHTPQIAWAPSATNALRVAAANPARHAILASSTPNWGQLRRDATTCRFSSLGPWYFANSSGPSW